MTDESSCRVPSGNGAAREAGPDRMKTTSAGILSTLWDWDRLVVEFFPRLVAAGHRRFRLSREDCEDALQRVAQEIVARRPRARVPEAFLTTAFYRRCLKIAQARRLIEMPPLETDRVDDPRARLAAQTDISMALARVGPRCRHVLSVYALEGRTLPETAEAIRLSPKSMWRRVQRCLGRMKRWMM